MYYKKSQVMTHLVTKVKYRRIGTRRFVTAEGTKMWRFAVRVRPGTIGTKCAPRMFSETFRQRDL